MENEAIKNDKKTTDKPWLFQPGNPGGPGRPSGVRDFNTDFDEAVEELAKEEGITLSEARKTLLKVAYKQAKAGNYNFYKDVVDRKYGSVTQKNEHTGKDGQPIVIEISKEVLDKNASDK